MLTHTLNHIIIHKYSRNKDWQFDLSQNKRGIFAHHKTYVIERRGTKSDWHRHLSLSFGGEKAHQIEGDTLFFPHCLPTGSVLSGNFSNLPTLMWSFPLSVRAISHISSPWAHLMLHLYQDCSVRQATWLKTDTDSNIKLKPEIWRHR